MSIWFYMVFTGNGWKQRRTWRFWSWRKTSMCFVFHVECKACMCVCVCFGCMHMFASECYALCDEGKKLCYWHGVMIVAIPQCRVPLGLMALTDLLVSLEHQWVKCCGCQCCTLQLISLLMYHASNLILSFEHARFSFFSLQGQPGLPGIPGFPGLKGPDVSYTYLSTWFTVRASSTSMFAHYFMALCSHTPVGRPRCAWSTR